MHKTILYTVSGSQAYGMATDTSDIDIRGVALGSRESYLGLSGGFEQLENPEHFPPLDVFSPREQEIISRTKLEGTIYELRKFLRLALGCNPNIIEVLYCRDEEVRLITPEGERLREARDLFLSAKAKHTLSGYATSQINRIKRHNRWLLDPPKAPPDREDFGLGPLPEIPKSHMDSIQAEIRKMMELKEFDLDSLPVEERSLFRERVVEAIGRFVAPLHDEVHEAMWISCGRRLGLEDNLLEIMRQERQFASAMAEWKSYRRWEKERNPERAALEAKYGMDCKHASHAVRLFRMGREILETGKVHVWRGPGGPDDAEELLAIRNGAWTYDQLLEWCSEQDSYLGSLYRDKRYVVPKAPDFDGVDRLCVAMIQDRISENE